MASLKEQLPSCLQGRVCLVGVGNPAYGDDGVGVRLAEILKSEVRSPTSDVRSDTARSDASEFGVRSVIVAGTTPERWLGRLADGGFDTVLFLDAVEIGSAPGSVVLLSADAMTARYPQVSTHRLSLGLLGRLLEAGGRTKVWLLGIQPESLRQGTVLSRSVAATVDYLAVLLREEPAEVLA